MSSSITAAHASRSRRITSGSQELDAKIKEWLVWDKNKNTSDHIKDLVRAETFDELRTILMTRLRYTVDGFFGSVGAGYNALNDLFIIQCAQGILRYLESNESAKLKTAGIVVGFDSRRGSRRFAELVTTVFIQKNFPVKLYTVVVPMCFVPYAVVKYGSAGGVMICSNSSMDTDNGIQIYDSTGLQVVFPLEEEIEDYINHNLEPNTSSWDTSILNNTDMKTNPLSEILKSYLEMIFDETLHEYREINKKSSLSFVYTAIHGVAFIYMARAMSTVHLKMIPVEAEKYPNPEFQRNSVPDFKGIFKLDEALTVAQKEKSEYILGNSYDGSCVIIAERNPITGEFKFFNADEIALLLSWWTYHVCQAKIVDVAKEPDLYVVGSIFSTKLTKEMARIDGFFHMETFTGKWLGNTIKKLIDSGKKVLLGFDGYGYIVNMDALAKDGIHAGVHLASLVNYLAHHKLTLRGHLEDLYKQYGFYASTKFCFTSDNESSIHEIYNRLRNFKGTQTYPRSMSDGRYIIRYIRDLKYGLDTAAENRKATLPRDPNIELVAFTFDNSMIGSIYNHHHKPLSITLHTSIDGPVTTPQSIEDLKALLARMTYTFIDEFIEPKRNNLTTHGMDVPNQSDPSNNECH